MNTLANPDFTIDAFEAGNIDPERFNHEAHVYVGWLYVSKYELPEAISRFDTGLKRLVKKVGAVGKYHATLTWFFLVIIAERANANESWQAFRHRNTDIFDDVQKTLSRYYSQDFLYSDRARERFLLPNNLAKK